MWTPDQSQIITVEQKQADADRVKRDEVVIERERRLSLGFDYDFGDDRGVHRIGTSSHDMNGWDEVTKAANAMLALDDQSSITLATETGSVHVTAIEWQYILLAAAAFRQPIWQASFALQEMSPMPADVTADEFWP